MASWGIPFGYATVPLRFRKVYTLTPLAKRAVVPVGRQWLGPA